MTVFSKLTDLNDSFAEYQQTQQQVRLEDNLSKARNAIGVVDTLSNLKNLTTGVQILGLSIDCTKLQAWLYNFRSLNLKSTTPNIDVSVLDKLRQIKEDVRLEQEAMIRKFRDMAENQRFHSEGLSIPHNQLTPEGQQLRFKLLSIQKEHAKFIDDHQHKLPDNNAAYQKHVQNRQTLLVDAPRLATLTSDEAKKAARAQAKQDIDQLFEKMRSEGITYDRYLELCNLITDNFLGHDYAPLLAKCRIILPSE